MTSSLPTRARLFSLPSPTLAQADDAVLSRAASAGDPRAASVLWDRFSPLVRRVLCYGLGPQIEVESLVQRVFLRVFAKLSSLPEAAALRPFVLGVTVRVLGRELRRRRMQRVLRLAPRISSAGADSLPEDPTASAALLALYGILDQLTPEARMVFALRHFEGLQLSELAAVADVPVATAKRRLAAATLRVEHLAHGDAALRAYTVSASRDAS